MLLFKQTFIIYIYFLKYSKQDKFINLDNKLRNKKKVGYYMMYAFYCKSSINNFIYKINTIKF